MLKQNNSEIDASLISERVAQNATTPPLAVLPEAGPVQLDHEVIATAAAAAQATSAPVATDDAVTRSGQVPAHDAPARSGLFAYLAYRYRKISAPGLSLKQRIRLFPVLGYLVAWSNALLRLPVTRHHTAVELDRLRAQTQDMSKRLCELEQQVKRTVEITVPESHKSAISLQRYEALDIGNRLMQYDQLQISRKFKVVHQLMQIRHADEVGKLRQEHQLLRRLEQLEQKLSALTSLPAEGANHVQNAAAPEVTAPGFDRDKFYVEFEALFRGSPEDIKQRLAVYLPYLGYLKEMKAQDRATVIDVGCGRGEWLELMGEHDIPALGIDMNAAMVDRCLQRGLAAKYADAIAYLREQPEASVGAVTGFHLIEHLPFETMIALFDAALHALRPGGIIIFETPNPENLIVGACNFYYDPTHLHPVVPNVAEFIARQRGFSHAEILRLHPFPEDYQMPGNGPVDQAVNKFLFSAQDYAVIARK